MLRDLVQHRKLIGTLARNELRARYLGTSAGFVWGIINPAMVALIYWFIFSSIFYSGRFEYDGFVLPYICYFLAGYAPWLLFQETVSRSLNVIVENPNYVKKIIFPLQVLAPIQFLASSVSHLVILMVLFIIMLSSGIALTTSILLLLPYYLALAAFTLGVCWMVSAINIFVRDTAQVVSLLLNVWFWFCPIVWATLSMPEQYRGLFNLNPFVFFVDGYRHALFAGLYFTPHSHDPNGMYLLVITGTFLLGRFLFKRLQPHFSDVI